ncbi:MAG: hypothetical protein ACFB0E_13960 [Leptolyngbyaceae cyanobacterium]
MKILNPRCKDSSFLGNGKVSYEHPITVFVEPWRGRHNVYGIFKLPYERKLKYPVMLTVKGAGSYRKEKQMVKTKMYGHPIKPEYISVKVCLKTRVALLMILRGSLNQLKEPLNWTLAYTTFK